MEHEGVRLIMEILASSDFKERVAALGGYEVEMTGSIIAGMED